MNDLIQRDDWDRLYNFIRGTIDKQYRVFAIIHNDPTYDHQKTSIIWLHRGAGKSKLLLENYHHLDQQDIARMITIPGRTR